MHFSTPTHASRNPLRPRVVQFLSLLARTDHGAFTCRGSRLDSLGEAGLRALKQLIARSSEHAPLARQSHGCPAQIASRWLTSGSAENQMDCISTSLPYCVFVL